MDTRSYLVRETRTLPWNLSRVKGSGVLGFRPVSKTRLTGRASRRAGKGESKAAQEECRERLVDGVVGSG